MNLTPSKVLRRVEMRMLTRVGAACFHPIRHFEVATAVVVHFAVLAAGILWRSAGHFRTAVAGIVVAGALDQKVAAVEKTVVERMAAEVVVVAAAVDRNKYLVGTIVGDEHARRSVVPASETLLAASERMSQLTMHLLRLLLVEQHVVASYSPHLPCC